MGQHTLLMFPLKYVDLSHLNPSGCYTLHHFESHQVVVQVAVTVCALCVTDRQHGDAHHTICPQEKSPTSLSRLKVVLYHERTDAERDSDPEQEASLCLCSRENLQGLFWPAFPKCVDIFRLRRPDVPHIRGFFLAVAQILTAR